jgi:hypothetical protein
VTRPRGVADRVANALAGIAGWATVTVGIVHMAVARPPFDDFDIAALWFVGSGLAVLLVGGITLAARRAAIRGLALAANAAGLALAVAFGMLTQWREPQGPLLVALFLVGGLGVARAGPRPPS